MRIVHPVRRVGRCVFAIALGYAPVVESAAAGVGIGARAFTLAGRSFGVGVDVTVRRP